MATSLTFTSAGFMQGSTYSISTSVNTKYDILSVDATYTRRIYGLSVASTDAGAQTLKFHLHDGKYFLYHPNILNIQIRHFLSIHIPEEDTNKT